MSTEDTIVGLSISEPDTRELVRLGLSEIHVRYSFIEVVRHVLSRGWSVAYGGDLRVGGYTEALFDLIRTYDRKDLAGPDRVLSYMAWPLWLDVTAAQRAELANVAVIKEVERPSGAPVTLPPLASRQPSDLLWNSLALTQLRARMNAEIGARFVLGGRVYGQQGLYPGAVEEAALALQSGVPLYVVGGFGGCGRVIAAALDGLSPTELSIEYQLEHTPRYPELVEAAASAGRAVSFRNMLNTFAAAGVAGLRNGLEEQENRSLLATDDVDEIVALFLRGIGRVITT